MQETVDALGVAFTDFIPTLLGAALILLVAFFIARFLQRLVGRFLRDTGFDNLFDRTGTESALERIGLSKAPSAILGYVVFWGVILAGVASALSILGLPSLQANMDLLVALAGRALIAILILAVGLAAAGWLSNLASQETERAGISGGDLFGRAAFVVVLAIAVLLAATQLGVEVSLLIVLTVLILGTVALVTTIALGVGLVPLSGNVTAGRYVKENLRQGDEISVNGVEGTVEEMGYASITVRSEDGILHYIPNRIMLEGVMSKKPRLEREPPEEN